MTIVDKILDFLEVLFFAPIGAGILAAIWISSHLP